MRSAARIVQLLLSRIRKTLAYGRHQSAVPRLVYDRLMRERRKRLARCRHHEQQHCGPAQQSCEPRQCSPSIHRSCCYLADMITFSFGPPRSLARPRRSLSRKLTWHSSKIRPEYPLQGADLGL